MDRSLARVGAAAGRAATIYDVARLAGVSHQTVSRVLNAERSIRPATRARVESAISSLGYHRNPVATALATSRSHRLGALAYGLMEGGPSTFMAGASAAAREAGYVLDVVSLTAMQHQVVADAIALLEQQDLAGILAFSPSDPVRAALAHMQFQVPVVVSTEPEDGRDGAGGPTGNTIGVRLAMEHLVGLGHRRIAHVAGPGDWLSARIRTQAFVAVAAELGVVAAEVVEGDWTARSGYHAGRRVRLDGGVTAILAANDQMALGVVRALSERGVRVPEQMSVVGFDDIPDSGYYLPPLTTVRLDFSGYGREAITTLLRQIDPQHSRQVPAPEDPRLIVRASTAAVPS